MLALVPSEVSVCSDMTGKEILPAYVLVDSDDNSPINCAKQMEGSITSSHCR